MTYNLPIGVICLSNNPDLLLSTLLSDTNNAPNFLTETIRTNGTRNSITSKVTSKNTCPVSLAVAFCHESTMIVSIFASFSIHRSMWRGFAFLTARCERP